MIISSRRMTAAEVAQLRGELFHTQLSVAVRPDLCDFMRLDWFISPAGTMGARVVLVGRDKSIIQRVVLESNFILGSALSRPFTAQC